MNWLGAWKQLLVNPKAFFPSDKKEKIGLGLGLLVLCGVVFELLSFLQLVLASFIERSLGYPASYLVLDWSLLSGIIQWVALLIVLVLLFACFAAFFSKAFKGKGLFRRQFYLLALVWSSLTVVMGVVNLFFGIVGAATAYNDYVFYAHILVLMAILLYAFYSSALAVKEVQKIGFAKSLAVAVAALFVAGSLWWFLGTAWYTSMA